MKSIKVQKNTWKKLFKIKVVTGQSIDEIIVDLLKKRKSNPSEDEAMLK